MELQVYAKKGMGHRIYQDALNVSVEPKLKIIVCDGHGGKCYCRSNLGAKIATKIAMETKFDGNLDKYVNEIHLQFLHLIQKHYQFRPFNEFEKELTKELDDPLYAYGTTILGVVESNNRFYAFRVGDGYLFYQDENYQWLDLFGENSIGGLTPSSLVEKKIQVEKAKLPEFNSILVSSDGISGLYGSDFVKEKLYSCQLNDNFVEFIINQTRNSKKNDDCSVVYLNYGYDNNIIRLQHDHLLVYYTLKQKLSRIKEVNYLINRLDINKNYFNQLVEEKKLLKNQLSELLAKYHSFKID